jgi:hypothetical protein
MRLVSRSVLWGAAVLIAGCGGAGDPRGAWSVATSGSVRAAELGTPLLALRADGSGLVAVEGSVNGGRNCDERDAVGAYVARRDSVGRLSPLRAVRGDLLSAPAPLADGTFAVLLGEPSGATSCGLATRLVLARLSSDGRVASRRTLTAAGEGDGAVLAQGAGGTLAVAWAQAGARGGAGLRVVLRSPDGTRTKTAVRAPGADDGAQEAALDGVDVAVAPDGGALVSFARDQLVWVVAVRSDGRVDRRVGVGDARDATTTDVEVAPDGRAAVLWGTQDGGEERDEPYVVRAAVRRAGASMFMPAQVLGRSTAVDDPAGNLQLALTADGGAAALFDRVDLSDRPLLLAQAGRDGVFGAPARLAGDVSLAGFGARDDGAAVLGVVNELGRFTVRLRGPGAARFGPEDEVAGGRVTMPAVRFGPGGRVLAAWIVERRGASAVRVAERRRR